MGLLFIFGCALVKFATIEGAIEGFAVKDRGEDGCAMYDGSGSCSVCEGNCKNDDECVGSLKCFVRESESDTVPRCGSEGYVNDHNYCYAPQTCNSASSNGRFVLNVVSVNDKGGRGCSATEKCALCEGDCDSDDDCVGSLKCFHRESSEDLVPGCSQHGLGESAAEGRGYYHDYCYNDGQRNKRGTQGRASFGLCHLHLVPFLFSMRLYL